MECKNLERVSFQQRLFVGKELAEQWPALNKFICSSGEVEAAFVSVARKMEGRLVDIPRGTEEDAGLRPTITRRLALAVAGILLVAPTLPAFAQPTCRGLPVTISAVAGVVTNGTAGADVIWGTNGDDTINGNGGDDTICGRDGNDTIHGNDGDDNIVGGDGNDTIFGDDDNDTLAGNDGIDSLTGGLGDDRFNCGAGADVADGTNGNESLGPNHQCEVRVNIP